MSNRSHAHWIACAVITGVSALAAGAPLRIVSYNIAADIDGYTTARPGLMTVLEGIGNEASYAPARTIDVLTLQETTSNVVTVAPIVVDLNNLYGTGTYAMSSYQATVNGGNPSGGNGPNALIYKTTSLILVDSVGVGTPSTQGAPRQPARYQFRPIGGTVADDFYVYVSHYKAGTSLTDRDRRNVEAQLLRDDANALPGDPEVLYTGDFNMYTSNEAAYQTLLAAGQGQAFDPVNRPGNWQNNAAFQDIMTYSAIDVHARFDFQLLTQNVMTEEGRLTYIPGSYHTFGVNGSTDEGDSVDLPSNTALPGLPNRSAVLTALTTASDHLPVVVDYTIVITNPPSISLNITSFERTVIIGGALPDDTFTVTNTGVSPLNYTITPSVGWLSPSPPSGTSTGEADTITIVYSVGSLAAGTHNATLSVADPVASNSPQNVTVTLHVVLSMGDFDHDGDMDMSDYGHLQACFSQFPPAPSCADADLNADNVVEQADLTAFLNCMAGADVPPGC